MSDPKDALPPLSGRLLREAEELQRLERERRTVDISTPEFHRIADEVARRARSVFSLATEEEELGERIPTSDETIDEVARQDDA